MSSSYPPDSLLPISYSGAYDRDDIILLTFLVSHPANHDSIRVRHGRAGESTVCHVVAADTLCSTAVLWVVTAVRRRVESVCLDRHHSRC